MTSYPPQGVGIRRLSDLLIDISKNWQGYNITNLGAGGHDVNARLNLLLAHHTRHEPGGPDEVVGVTPGAHASTHLSGGVDEVLNLANINAAVGFSLEAHKSRHASGGADALTDADIDGIVGFDLGAHASRHVDGGADEITSKLDFRAMNIIKARATYDTNFTTSSTSPVDVTGISVTIDLPVTSNVLVFFIAHSIANDSGEATWLRILRDATNIREVSFGYASNANERYNSPVFALDENVASGSHTYKLQAWVDAGTTLITMDFSPGEIFVIAFPA